MKFKVARHKIALIGVTLSHKMAKHTQTIDHVCLTILWGWQLNGYEGKGY